MLNISFLACTKVDLWNLTVCIAVNGEKVVQNATITREGFSRKNIVAVSFFQNCAIHPYSYSYYIFFPLNEIIQA